MGWGGIGSQLLSHCHVKELPAAPEGRLAPTSQRGESPGLGQRWHLAQTEDWLKPLMSSFLRGNISLVCFSLGYLVEVGISPSDSGNNLVERKKEKKKKEREEEKERNRERRRKKEKKKKE